MADNRRRNTFIIIAILIIVAIVLFLLKGCPKKGQEAKKVAQDPVPAAKQPPPPAASAPTSPTPPPAAEILTPATITTAEKASAGSTLSITWTGPNNTGDFITIVAKAAPDNATANYKLTQEGSPLELVAPTSPGPHEIRYITARSKTILGRAAVELLPITASVDAPAEVTLGSQFSVTWTGPNNQGDYVTIVPKEAGDSIYASYADTAKGTSLKLTAPTTTGDCEVRYVTGQDKKVLARRAIKVLPAQVSLDAPASAIAGTTIQVKWSGPNNSGDYITVVPKDFPETQYGNYTNTAAGSPLSLLIPIFDGAAEIRYQTGDGSKILARRAITIIAAKVTLTAPAEAAAGTDVTITWTGPNNPGDFITIVPKSTPEGQYGPYANTDRGSPMTITMPKVVGNNAPTPSSTEGEVRYMTGQGSKVIARVPIKLVQ